MAGIKYFDENDKPTSPEKAAYAVIGKTNARENLAFCSYCKKQKPTSAINTLGVCGDCDSKIKENPKTGRRGYRGRVEKSRTASKR